MSRNQNRIEGNYSIVSVSKDVSILKDFHNTNAAISYAQSKGCSVEVVVGFWHDTQELALRISGLDHLYVAQRLAEDYRQDAYIVVGNGSASLIEAASDTVLKTWTEQHTGLSDKGDGTMTATGHGWHFA